MELLKRSAKKILNLIDPDLETRLIDQYRFSKLNRRPPDLMWKAIAPSPKARLDAGRGQIGHELFVFGGFQYMEDVIRVVDVFDMEKEKWTKPVDLPKDMAQTHLGAASDEKRYVYLISGQLGRNCRPATPDCFVFDALNRSFSKLPPLPKPRYAPAAQIWRGRLHSIGGAKEDRNAPATDHWSIAVENGKALENKWREEPPIPHGGHHRASAVLYDELYVFGGQEGDYIAIPGDPDCRCTAELTSEIRFPDTYRLKAGAKQWDRRADMAVLSSHTESSVIKVGEKLFILGGDYERFAKKDVITINDEIQLYDARADSWKIVGRLPCSLKAMASGYYKGNLYVTTGQRNRAMGDKSPLNRFERGTWKVKFEV